MMEWRGYVVRSIEDHEKLLEQIRDELRQLNRETNQRVACLERDFEALKSNHIRTNTEWSLWKKVVVAIAGIASSVIGSIILNYLGF